MEPEVHYHNHNSPSIDPNLNQTNLVQILKLWFLQIDLNVILLSVPLSPKSILLFRCRIHFSSLSFVSHNLWFDNPNKIWQRMQTIMLLDMCAFLHSHFTLFLLHSYILLLILFWSSLIYISTLESRTLAQAVNRVLPSQRTRFDPRLAHVGSAVNKMAMGQVPSKYFGVHWLLHISWSPYSWTVCRSRYRQRS
jgi:hypothetical protein